MQLSPYWEANRTSASQAIPRILCSPMVHYRAHKRPPPVPILSQINLLHDSPTYFFNTHLSMLLPSTPRSSARSLSLRSPHQTPVCSSPLPHTCHMQPPSHFFFDYRIIFGGDHSSWSSSLLTLLHSPIISSLLGPNVFLRNPILEHPWPKFPQYDGPSFAHRKQQARLVLSILIFIFLDSILKDKRFCTKWQQAVPDRILLLISSKMLELFPNIRTVSPFKGLLRIFTLWFCASCWSRP